MPTLLATLVASVVAWALDGPLRAVAGAGASTLAGLVVGTVAFFVSKRFFADLRGGA
ncbi:MAG TPA: hypothetical protein VMW35_01005 [Myxococcota bacterium]|jgi:hypothetical protein|nr:hypothetical protein [Myxococcota bacterium]